MRRHKPETVVSPEIASLQEQLLISEKRHAMISALESLKSAGSCKRELRPMVIDGLVADADTALHSYKEGLKQLNPSNPNDFVDFYSRESLLMNFSLLAIEAGQEFPKNLDELQENPKLRKPIEDALRDERQEISKKLRRALGINGPNLPDNLGSDEMTPISRLLPRAYGYIRNNDATKLELYLESLIIQSYDSEELYSMRLAQRD